MNNLYTEIQEALVGEVSVLESLLSKDNSLSSKEGQERLEGWIRSAAKVATGHPRYDKILSLLLSKSVKQGTDLDMKVSTLFSGDQFLLCKLAGLGLTNSVNILLDKGASIDAKNKQGNTPLYKVVSLPKEAIAMSDLLLERGASPKAQNEKGMTPLHEAASMGHEVIARHFLEKDGSAINTQDKKGRTPLHTALYATLEGGNDCIEDGSHSYREYKPKFSVMEVLVAYGADLSLTDHSQKTPLDLCSSCPHSTIIANILGGKYNYKF